MPRLCPSGLGKKNASVGFGGENYSGYRQIMNDSLERQHFPPIDVKRSALPATATALCGDEFTGGVQIPQA